MGLMARQGTQHRVPHHVVVAKCQWAEIPVVSVWCGEKYGTFQNKLAKRGFHYMIWNYYFCSIFIFNFKIQISRSEVAVTYFQTMESLRHCWRYHLVLTDPELCRWWGHIFWGTSCLFTYFNSNVMALLYNIMLWKIMSFYCYDSIFLVAPSFLGAVFCPVGNEFCLAGQLKRPTLVLQSLLCLLLMKALGCKSAKHDGPSLLPTELFISHRVIERYRPFGLYSPLQQSTNHTRILY